MTLDSNEFIDNTFKVWLMKERIHKLGFTKIKKNVCFVKVNLIKTGRNTYIGREYLQTPKKDFYLHYTITLKSQ
jgi:hypothetical protein